MAERVHLGWSGWQPRGRGAQSADQGPPHAAHLLLRRCRVTRPALCGPRRGLPAHGPGRGGFSQRRVRRGGALRSVFHGLPRGPASSLPYADRRPVGRRDLPRNHRSDPEGRTGPFPHCLRGSRRRRLRHHRPDIAATIGATRGDCRNVLDSRVTHGFRSRHGRHRRPHRTGDRWHPGRARGPCRLCGCSHGGAVATAPEYRRVGNHPSGGDPAPALDPHVCGSSSPFARGRRKTTSAGRGAQGHGRDPRRRSRRPLLRRRGWRIGRFTRRESRAETLPTETASARSPSSGTFLDRRR